MRLVVLESPYGGTPEEVERNVAYARACLADCLSRGEAPIAGHILYTQPGVLDDNNPEERKLGIQAHLAWAIHAKATVVYVDLLISKGMKTGIIHADLCSRPVAYRDLPDWEHKT